jgi:Holliday junction DNA helicase RuvA
VIALVNGILVRKDPAGTVVVDSGSVGYRIFVSLTTLVALPDEGETVTLNTVTVVRDDAMHLYGFAGLDEMEIFNLLVQVKGVGPRLALALLGGLKAPELKNAISSEDAGSISTVPGVGKKTAERIILELKAKVQPVAGHSPDIVPGVSEEVVSDVISALVNLGYRASDSRTALKAVLEGTEQPPPFEDLIRECLKVLAGRKGR